VNRLSLSELFDALAYVERQPDAGIARRQIQEWQRQLNELAALERKPVECSVALLGDSGVGKSSLLNALIGMDLLPHDTSRAVTSAVTELVQTDADAFTVTPDLLSRSELHRAFTDACRDVTDAVSTLRADDPSAAGDDPQVHDAIDKADWTLIQTVSDFKVPADVAACPPEQWLTHLLAPVTAALADRSTHIRTFERDNLEGLRKHCRDYLSSRGCLWPLVCRLRVSGPFQHLPSRFRLLDLPGLNDPDPRRIKIAHDALAKASRVWLVVSSKRGITESLRSFLQSSRLLTQLHAQNGLEALALVATHADDYDPGALLDEFGQDAELDVDAALRLHAERTRNAATKVLLDAWDHTIQAARGQVDRQTPASGTRILSDVPFFSVSSTEYLALTNTKRGHRKPRLDNPGQTGIPALLEWLHHEYLVKEQQRQVAALAEDRWSLQTDMHAAIARSNKLAKRIAQLNSKGKGGLKDVEHRALTFLEEKLRSHHQQATHQVDKATEKVTGAINQATENIDTLLFKSVKRLEDVHWSTLRAIVRRRGQFVSNSSNKRWDVLADIAEVIFGQVALRWSDLFQRDLVSFMDGLHQECGSLISTHEQFLDTQIHVLLEDQWREAAPDGGSVDAINLRLKNRHNDLATELHATRTRFRQRLLGSLREQLAPAFDKAAEESGRGMKNRMVDILSSHLGQATATLPDLTHELRQSVNEVHLQLTGEVQHAHASVRESAARSRENLRVQLEAVTPAQLRERIAATGHVLTLLGAPDSTSSTVSPRLRRT